MLFVRREPRNIAKAMEGQAINGLRWAGNEKMQRRPRGKFRRRRRPPPWAKWSKRWQRKQVEERAQRERREKREQGKTEEEREAELTEAVTRGLL